MNGEPLPSAIVLARGATGLAVVRALGQAGVDVHAFVFDRRDPTQRSKYCSHVEVVAAEVDETVLMQRLVDHSLRLGNRPVVFPTSDRLALLLAYHAASLARVCRVWNNSAFALESIICKDRLYASAADAGVAIIPSIVSNNIAAIANWANDNAAPYLVKPFYEGIETASLKSKNLLLDTREKLLAHLHTYGSKSVVIQRALRGGDGYIFDCYGLCDSSGTPRVLASHRRIRQHRPDFGATCYGEIPAAINIENQIFDSTRQLLAHVRYHGIFGIEWLYERDTGRTYIIDFNARPFTTLGHLTYCGLNLPALAYAELTRELPASLDPAPRLTHAFWIDFRRDLESFREKNQRGDLSIGAWILSLLRCRSFAYTSWQDPMPGIASLRAIVGNIGRYVFRLARRRHSPDALDHNSNLH